MVLRTSSFGRHRSTAKQLPSSHITFALADLVELEAEVELEVEVEVDERGGMRKDKAFRTHL